ncbi:MAG: hypothetical protein ACR2QK_01910, partial [Acidimicrobiales bacterium]
MRHQALDGEFLGSEGVTVATWEEQLATLQARVGSGPSVTEWFEIDQRAVDVFAGVTADFDEKHNDPSWARFGPWGGTI